ncbi:MAG: hypothetical protein IJR01_02015 [Bacteroidales bacterium]|nr:hypothetical protein [Bacteroidales bacterium]
MFVVKKCYLRDRMRRVILLMMVLGFAACSKSGTDSGPVEYGDARITAIIPHPDHKVTAYNFVYPSTDPFGQPVMLSGTFTVDSKAADEKKANGIALINHYTIFKANECPSRGELDMQYVASGSGLITVSADYYGFGVTQSKPQAYCLASANARASVDALLGARELIPTLGLSFRSGTEDILYNIGYSEGGQTSIGVVKIIAEEYPDIKISHTFAGAGSYDVVATYKEFLKQDLTGMPSTVISVIIACNEFYRLGIPLNRMFKQPVLGDIGKWILSKKYTRTQIDKHIGSLAFSSFATDEILNPESEIAIKLADAMENENLCKGWTPRGDEKISLYHHRKDITVPVVCSENLYNFLVDEKGLSKSNVSLYINDSESEPAADGSVEPYHEFGARAFATSLVLQIAFDLLLHGVVWVPEI